MHENTSVYRNIILSRYMKIKARIYTCLCIYIFCTNRHTGTVKRENKIARKATEEKAKADGW
jgi:hypothetical protein